jgi:DNA polymerase-1
MFHYSYVSRNEKDSNLRSQYDRDLDFAVNCFDKKPFKWQDESGLVEIVSRYEDVVELLNDFIDDPPKTLYVDFETTGIKPYRAGHKVVSVALCESNDISYSFPLQYRDHWTKDQLNDIIKLLKVVLENPKIGKQAHNMKFEDEWASVVLNCQTSPWDWDSMLGARIIDNRSKWTSLAFQTFINFGVRGYGAEINRYKKGSPFNNMDKAPISELLTYNGLDALYGKRLVDIQKPQIKGKQKEAYGLFHKGTLEFSKIQQQGIHTDEKYYEEQQKSLKKQIKALEHELMHGEDAAKFEKKFKRKLLIKEKDFSPTDLGLLFYEVLKKDPVYTEKTRDFPEHLEDKKRYSINAAIIETFDEPFAVKLIRLRQLKKTSNTYLGQYARESHDCKMHPSFDLIVPISYRSSSSDPNFQNVPVREEEAKKIVRSGIFPTKGWRLLEADYKSIEVVTGSFYHKDPNMIKYLTDPATDMHRDSASDIWRLPEKEVTSEIRFHAKNGWVFPQFYGSYFKTCAKDLWDRCVNLKNASGVTLKEHIKHNGIRTYQSFVDHCQEVERIFWKERFRVYDDWRRDINAFYRRKGYIETFFGFRYRGYMSTKEAANYPIQGTAFHILLWTVIELGKWVRKNNLESKIIGQIHDSIVIDLSPNEEEEVIEALLDIGTKQVQEKYNWITIPLEMELEITPTDGSWYEKKELQ